MTYKERGKRTVEGLFGCPGTIERVSDEKTMLRRKKLGLGWVYIMFADKSEDWQLLRPTFHNANRAGGWRIIEKDDVSLDDGFTFEDKSEGEEENESDEGESGANESDCDDMSESSDGG